MTPDDAQKLARDVTDEANAMPDRRGHALKAERESVREVKRLAGQWVVLMLTFAQDEKRSEGNRLGAIERELSAMLRALAPD